MKIALIGATGFTGTKILSEALARGHRITAIVRHPEKLPVHAALTAAKGDIYKADEVTKLVVGHDAVISAFNPGWGDEHLYENFLKGSKAITEGVKKAGVRRLLVIGGAGSLYVAPGVQLMDTPEFAKLVPANILPGVKAARDALELIKTETDLDWTFLSPAVNLFPGERTGKFRLGGDELVLDDKKESRISIEDLAVAVLDEIETPKHVRKRFTLGY